MKFAERDEASFHRNELTIFRHQQTEALSKSSQEDLYPFVLYRCVVGSVAYGLDQPGSDIDRRGFYLPPAHLEWSLGGVPEQLESDREEVYWEIEKFIRLALKSNPNVLECLYSPLVEHCEPIAEELLSIRHIFLSRHAYQTYNAYVLSQFKKLERDMRTDGQPRWKHVMHLIRLLLSGVTVLHEGFVPLRVDEYRARLMAIRRGEMPWAEIERWRSELHKDLDKALVFTRLPEDPDYARANEFLIQLKAEVAEHPYPLLFATVSGAHLYGFPSPDSDYDLRGVHVLPVPEAVGLLDKQETITSSHVRDCVEVDLVTHDALKFFQMLLKRNGYVLEQLFSPLVVHATPEHEELKAIARGCITRHHSHHYFGFAATQWGLFEKENPPKVKPLLYVYRVLLTGIHLMHTGIVEANLTVLNETFRLPYIVELVARKTSGPERAVLEGAEVEFHAREYQRLVSMLEDAAAQTELPVEPTVKIELNDLLVRLRLANS